MRADFALIFLVNKTIKVFLQFGYKKYKVLFSIFYILQVSNRVEYIIIPVEECGGGVMLIQWEPIEYASLFALRHMNDPIEKKRIITGRPLTAFKFNGNH